MKTIYIIFIFCFGLISSIKSQEFIIAGQIDSNIHATDYDPDYNAVYPGVNEFNLDLDNDGKNDLLFNVHYQINCNEYINWWTSVDLLSTNISIMTLAYPETILIKQLNNGDTISNNHLWNADSITKLYFVIYSKIVSTGQQHFSGTYSDGYVGYKMIYPNDTLFGWINIDATYRTITAKGNAILESSNGIKESSKTNNVYQVYPNPCRQVINLIDKSSRHSNKQFVVTDIYGKRIKSGNISSENSEIIMLELVPGVYFIKIIEKSIQIAELKFIKLFE